MGGRLLVHDAFSAVGVTLALAPEVIGRAQWRYRGRSGSLAEYERVAALSPAARAREVARGLAEVPWFVRNLVIKALLLARLPQVARLLGHSLGRLALLTAAGSGAQRAGPRWRPVSS